MDKAKIKKTGIDQNIDQKNADTNRKKQRQTGHKNAWITKIEHDFLRCGVAGWCLEVVFTSVESMLLRDWRLMAKTSLLMFPIYGMGAFLPVIGRWMDWWLGNRTLTVADRLIRHGLLYMVLIFAGEYLFGSLLRAAGICPWDYTGLHSNVDGLIRLDFAPLWFGTGLIFEWITEKKTA